MAKTIRLKEEQLKKVVNLLKEGYQRAPGQFYVEDMLDSPVSLSNLDFTQHWNERSGRTNTISQRAGNVGDTVYSFIVDTGHKNGSEIHTITEKAFIIIQNENSGKVVTILAARPGQIKRYWNKIRMPLPNDDTFNLIMRFAKNNESRGLNNS